MPPFLQTALENLLSPMVLFFGLGFLAARVKSDLELPEGIGKALSLYLMLAIGVARMARRQAIMRKLPAVETLGSTTVICSDKTGTLTENQMTVQEIVAGRVSYRVTGVGSTPEGAILRQENPVDPFSSPALLECLKAGLLCNDSRLVATAGGWEVQGDPTEGALIVSAHKAGLTADVWTQQWAHLDTIPFESQHQYMATLHDPGDDEAGMVYLKGAVEAVLERCGSCC
jgi:Ca2+-transporting ATPase